MYIHQIEPLRYRQPALFTRNYKNILQIIKVLITSLRLADITVPLVKKLCNNIFACIIDSESSHNTEANNTSGRNSLKKKKICWQKKAQFLQN